jgi:cell wall-associated NlpC family hydrolase
MRFMRLIPIALFITLLSGCITNPGDTQDLKQHSGPVKVLSDSELPSDLKEKRHIIPIRTLQNTAFVSLDDVMKATGFHGAWLRDGKYGVGDYDAVWTFQTGESTFMFAGKRLKIPAPAIKEGKWLYVPVSGLQKLFGDVTVFTAQSDNVAFFPKPSPNKTGVSGRNLNFSSVAAKKVKSTQMLSFAKKFLGIKYEFGTGEFKQTGAFDCSSYTQYVYEKFGIDLPRVARKQAEEGTFVARDKLQVGDLLFFNVPDRFKSHEVIGHVGMYIGDGKMIHASPKPVDGVQITLINKPYWKETFLFAKRYL